MDASECFADPARARELEHLIHLLDSAVTPLSQLGHLLDTLDTALTAATHLYDTLPRADPSPEAPWAFPVRSPAAWKADSFHGPTHTGVDLNLDRRPWGDIDRGEPVYAVADGTVIASMASRGWLGVVQVLHDHDGVPIWFRYAHLDPLTLAVVAGDPIKAGQLLGKLGNWTGGDGGDHLHLDCAITPFYWAAWLDKKVVWCDPIPILKEHLDPATVDSMLERGDA